MANPAERNSDAPLRIREAVRAVVIDPDQRVLLVRWQFPDLDVWGTPGGGIEPGEDSASALRRELHEELGLDDPLIGPQIWERTHIIPFIDGRWDGQHDRFFLIHTKSFEPTPRLTWEPLNAENLFELRCWTIDELDAFEPTTRREFFAPRRFQPLYRALLADGPQATPADTGV